MSSDKHKINIEHIAHLASINLSDNEKELFHNQLNQVIDYINQLNEVKTEELCEDFSNISNSDDLALDISEKQLNHNDVINNSPNAKNGEIIVPKIIDQ